MISEMQDHGFDDLDTDRLLGFLNDAYYDICSREPWPFLEAESDIATVAATATLTLPTDYNKTLSLINLTTGITLLPDRREAVQKTFAPNLTQSGQPGYYYFLGTSQMNLYPVPDRAYTLRLTYVRRPTALVAGTGGTATPIFPVPFHRLVVLGALVRAFSMEDELETAQAFAEQYEDRIQKMRDDLWTRQFDKPDYIVDVFDWDY